MKILGQESVGTHITYTLKINKEDVILLHKFTQKAIEIRRIFLDL